MAFDLATAKPVMQQPARVAGFDLATARPADPFAGDDLLSAESMSRLEAGERSTVTPTREPSMLERGMRYGKEVLGGIREADDAMARARTGGLQVPGFGAAEAVTSLATGAVAPALGSISGAILGFGKSPEEQERIAEHAQRLATYEPRSQAGRGYLQGVGALAKPVTDVAEATGADVALAPIAAEAQALRSARQTASEAGALKKAAKQAERERPPVPTTEELTQAAKGLYKAGEESGVIAPRAGYSSALRSVRGMVQDEGIDPTLHPKSSAVVKRLEQAEGKDLTLQEAETLRKIALDAEDDLNPVTREPTPDARLAAKIVDQLDESLDVLTVNSPARAMYARSRRSQLLDRLIQRAEIRAGANYTQAGMEHALRREFQTLALNPRRMRGLNSEQRTAVEKVAKGGNLENAMRNIGKFDPTTGGMAAALSFGTGGLAAMLGAGPMAALPAVAGFAGKRLATRMTGRNVERAREALVGRGLPQTNRTAQLAPAGEIAEAGDAFDAERAAAAEAARGGYEVDESPGQEIVLETAPGNRLSQLAPARQREAARSAVARRSESQPAAAQIESEMRALVKRAEGLPNDDPYLLELDALYQTLKEELALAKKRGKRNRVDQLSGGR